MAKKITVVANATIIGGTPEKPDVIATRGQKFQYEPDPQNPDCHLARGRVSPVPEAEDAEGVTITPSVGPTVTQQ
jgi:hypothetical protein